ncbi:2-vinyl bacteriochlorophyllide hydratase [Rhodopseudomonas faecalis]|uniref:2-vinyl bacteriochlorophyllide hydratase n=2 Tax=Rhodopseudomonas faecalis TaxID=99655 RepID=A0A318TDG8_9BRAD|nr:2-vinyl bacteriochlorophyllide hydratase [Rhodopseudomonas faecalis]
MHRPKHSNFDPAEDGAQSPDLPLRSQVVSHHRDALVSNKLYEMVDHTDAGSVKSETAVANAPSHHSSAHPRSKALYTPEQRVKRDATKWTLVQGILAPLQFLIFLISLGLVIRYLLTGEGFVIATWSIVIKTLVLYTIMITGAIWERVVFGCYLFAPAFFWEDVFSFLVLTLHTAYLVMLFGGFGSPEQQMWVALAAYAAYVINAGQFLLKLRAARLDEQRANAQAGGRA